MSKASDQWREQNARYEIENLKEILNSASPDTVSAIQEEVENKVGGYEAFLADDNSDPEPAEAETSESSDADSSEEGDDGGNDDEAE